MNSADLSKILEEHKVWITSMRESGSRANLYGADLYGANLRGADLRDANLCGANLYGANLRGANLYGANLRGANLYGADLYGANLRGADLRDADLRDADLPDLTFVILGEKYFISITNGEYVRAGCQNHTVEEWRKYSKQEIAEMDGRKALKFYPRLLDIIDFYIGKGERPDWLTSKEYADEVTE
ncbi:pentapeptide repeat-containing protein [Salmonella enterica]|nr:pentapeptide repeat-containing protein [Salmonella enterica]